MTEFALSADGTSIAYEVEGSGPRLVIVGGALNSRYSPIPLVPLLSDAFTVIRWDRRGRGESGDTAPYAVEREVEDLGAVLEATGGAAFVYGHSSGAILSILGALAGLPIERLAVYEPPYRASGPDRADPMGGVQVALDAGDRDSAVVAFMTGTGMPNADSMRQATFFPQLAAIAHTLPYDIAISGDGVVPAGRLASLETPILAMDGGASPDWAEAAAMQIADAAPNGRRVQVPGQNHNVAPEAVVPLLREFFA